MRECGVKIDLDSKQDLPEFTSDSSKFYYAINGELVAIFDLKDRLKNGAKEVVATFQKA